MNQDITIRQRGCYQDSFAWLTWRIKEYFCGLTAAPHATANLCVSVRISLRVREHCSSLWLRIDSTSHFPAIKS